MKEPWEEGRAPDWVNEVGSEFYILNSETDFLRMNHTTGHSIKGLGQHLVLRVRRGDFKDYLIINGVGEAVYHTGDVQQLAYQIEHIRLLYSKGMKV